MAFLFLLYEFFGIATNQLSRRNNTPEFWRNQKSLFQSLEDGNDPNPTFPFGHFAIDHYANRLHFHRI